MQDGGTARATCAMYSQDDTRVAERSTDRYRTNHRRAENLRVLTTRRKGRNRRISNVRRPQELTERAESRDGDR